MRVLWLVLRVDEKRCLPLTAYKTSVPLDFAVRMYVSWHNAEMPYLSVVIANVLPNWGSQLLSNNQ
jgi:hypothetical protein